MEPPKRPRIITVSPQPAAPRGSQVAPAEGAPRESTRSPTGIFGRFNRSGTPPGMREHSGTGSLTPSRWNQRISVQMREMEHDEIKAEQKASRQRFVWHANSTQRYSWDVLIAVCSLITAWKLPFLIGFGYEQNNALISLDFTMDIIFIADVFFNFRTGFWQGGVEVMDTKAIFKHYLRTWFIIDALGAFPFELMGIAFLGRTERKSIKIVLKYLKIPRLLRLARVVKFAMSYAQFMYTAQICNAFLVVLHWTACLFGGLVYDPDDDEDDDVWSAYWQTMLDAMRALLLVDSLDIDGGTGVVLITHIVGITFVALFIGSITSMLYMRDSAQAAFQQKVNLTLADLKQLHVPLDLQHRVRQYYAALWRTQKTMGLSSIYNDDDLSSTLRKEIALVVHRDMILSLPVFSDLPDDCLAAVMMALKTELYQPGNFIMYRGDVGRAMHVIKRGKVHVLGDDEASVVCELGEGTFFGEMALLNNVVRSATVQAADFCELKLLLKSDCLSLFRDFPALLTRISHVAASRAAGTLPADHHQSYAARSRSRSKRPLSSATDLADVEEKDEASMDSRQSSGKLAVFKQPPLVVRRSHTMMTSTLRAARAKLTRGSSAEFSRGRVSLRSRPTSPKLPRRKQHSSTGRADDRRLSSALFEDLKRHLKRSTDFGEKEPSDSAMGSPSNTLARFDSIVMPAGRHSSQVVPSAPAGGRAAQGGEGVSTETVVEVLRAQDALATRVDGLSATLADLAGMVEQLLSPAQRATRQLNQAAALSTSTTRTSASTSAARLRTASDDSLSMRSIGGGDDESDRDRHDSRHGRRDQRHHHHHHHHHDDGDDGGSSSSGSDGEVHGGRRRG